MRPSMKRDSEPVTSPLITSERPMVACSVGTLAVFTGAKEFVGVEYLVSDDCNMAASLPWVPSGLLRVLPLAVGSSALPKVTIARTFVIRQVTEDRVPRNLGLQ